MPLRTKALLSVPLALGLAAAATAQTYDRILQEAAVGADRDAPRRSLFREAFEEFNPQQFVVTATWTGRERSASTGPTR
jgi:hypothetical protein